MKHLTSLDISHIESVHIYTDEYRFTDLRCESIFVQDVTINNDDIPDAETLDKTPKLIIFDIPNFIRIKKYKRTIEKYFIMSRLKNCYCILFTKSLKQVQLYTCIKSHVD